MANNIFDKYMYNENKLTNAFGQTNDNITYISLIYIYIVNGLKHKNIIILLQ